MRPIRVAWAAPMPATPWRWRLPMRCWMSWPKKGCRSVPPNWVRNCCHGCSLPRPKTRAWARFRALGGMVACEFVDAATGAPDADLTKKLQQAALQKGLLLLTCGVYGNVMRFFVPADD